MSPERDGYIRLSFPFIGGERLAAKALLLFQSGAPLIVEERPFRVVLVRADPNDDQKCLVVMVDQPTQVDASYDPPLEGSFPPLNEAAEGTLGK